MSWYYSSSKYTAPLRPPRPPPPMSVLLANNRKEQKPKELGIDDDIDNEKKEAKLEIEMLEGVELESVVTSSSSVRSYEKEKQKHDDDLEARSVVGVEVELWKPSRKEWFIMISLSFISLMVALDATILVTVLPKIAHSLNGTTSDAFWTGTSYLLTSAVFQPVIASISQHFGRQLLLIISLAFFTLGTVLCCIATDFTVMLIGRSTQGVGGGGIITLCQVIFCDIVPLRQRPKYFTLVLGAWSVGSIVGPVVGGVLCDHTTWRWVFYINFPFCGLGFLLAVLFIRLDAVSKLSFLEKMRRTDWVGAVLFVGGTTAFLVGLSWSGVQYAWLSVQTLVPMGVGAFGVLLFVGWQIYVRPYSLLPMSLFYCASAIAAFYCAIANGLILFSGLYYFPFYFMAVLSASPTRAGIDLFPALAFLLPGSVVVAALTTRLGRFRWAIWLGWATTTLGCGLLLLLGRDVKIAVLATVMAIFGIGTGMVLTSVNVGVQAICRPEDCAMGASMYGFMRSLGMPLGVVISGTVFQNAMSMELSSHGLPTWIAHDSERFVHILREMLLPNYDGPVPGEMRDVILDAYVLGFQGVFVVMTCISASALVASFAIRKHNMDKILLTKFTAN